MRFGRLLRSAQRLVNRRGGMESLKEDARELKDIASGEGSLADKAKEASEALKTPGTPDRPTAPGEKGQKPPAEGTETPPAA